MIKVNEIISQPLFSDLRALTNEQTLEREVATVDITETPDVANFTTRRSLILTTAMVFNNKQKQLIPFIESLIEADVAGLCIKTSRFLQKVDPEVIEYANENRFPIIEIPAGTTLGILSHNLLDYILGKQTQNVLYALDIQKHYSNLFIAGASPQRILDELGATIKTPTILINPFMRQIAASSFFNKHINPVDYYVEQLSTKIDNRTSRVQSIKILDDKQAPIYVNVYPIGINSAFPYYLVIFNPNTLTYPIAHFAIDQGMMVLSYILYKNNMIENSMIRVQNSFFNKLLFGNHPEDRKDPEFFEQGLNYGLISTNYYQVILCEVREHNINKQYEEEIGILIYHWLLERTIPSLQYGLVFYRNKTKITSILLQHKVKDLEEKLIESAKDLEEMLGIRVHFGVGKSIDHPYETNNSYFEALKALEIDNDEYIKHYNPTGLMTLFNDENHDAIVYFIKDQLKDLAFSTEPFHVELLLTLKAFLDNQSEITTTAEKLFLHRNTISYRIKKCEELLDVDLKDSQTSLNLRVALELLDIKS